MLKIDIIKTKNVLLNWYSSMKKNWERFRWFLTWKIDFESQILALFDISRLHQFWKFNNFLWVYWFLAKNLSNFVPPCLKTQQLVLPYYACFVLEKLPLNFATCAWQYEYFFRNYCTPIVQQYAQMTRHNKEPKLYIPSTVVPLPTL